MSKKLQIVVAALLLSFTIGLSFGAGYTLATRTGAGAEPGMDNIKQAWDIIFSDYVDKDAIDAYSLSRAAIEGMVQALGNPYTSYLDAEASKQAMNRLEGKIEGIRVQVSGRYPRASPWHFIAQASLALNPGVPDTRHT